MKVSSVSGFVLLVNDLDKTAKFYNSLGFRFGRREYDRLVVYVNWFSVEFTTDSSNEEDLDNKSAGVFFLFSVLKVDEFYKEVLATGYKPEGEPEDKPTGRREFTLRDPDGYKLVFFTKK